MKTELVMVVEGITAGKPPWRQYSRELWGREMAERHLSELQERIDNPPEETWQPRVTFAELRQRQVTEWEPVSRTTGEPKYGDDGKAI